MHLDLTNRDKNRYSECVESDTMNYTIVIDNGTYECKAGYMGGEPQMIFRNVLYRHKSGSSLENFQGASMRTMFDGDVIINFEILECIMDQILIYLKPKRLVNLIFTEKIHSPTHVDLVRFLFDVYGFERIQIGVDSCYSYLHNLQDGCVINLQDGCMIVDMSHSAITCLVIDRGRIVEVYKINFGGNAAGEYLSGLMFSKFLDNKKDYKNLIPYLRCSNDYNKESVEILEMIRSGDYSRNYFMDEEFEMKNEEFVGKKQKICTIPVSNVVPEVNIDLLNVADDSLDAEGIKEKRKQKILYHSSLHRFKMKVEKCLERLLGSISSIEEEYEKLKDLDGFIERKKNEFQLLKREVEMRNKLRKDVKNRRTYEFQVRFKEGELSFDEQALIERIKDAEDVDKEDVIMERLSRLTYQIKELDPYFEPYTADTLDLINGYFIGRMNVNVDLLKVPEIIFSPSIIGLDQMGLSEIMEDVCRKYPVRAVLLTGGFSKIKGIDERIRDEMSSMSFVGDIDVIRAHDLDSFKGARFSEMFPTYTLDQYNELGAERLVELLKNMAQTPG